MNCGLGEAGEGHTRSVGRSRCHALNNEQRKPSFLSLEKASLKNSVCEGKSGQDNQIGLVLNNEVWFSCPLKRRPVHRLSEDRPKLIVPNGKFGIPAYGRWMNLEVLKIGGKPSSVEGSKAKSVPDEEVKTGLTQEVSTG